MIQAEISSKQQYPKSDPPPASRQASPGSWVEQELESVNFGDQRLVKRSQRILKSFFAHPMASIPEACGSVAAAKAAYDFFDNLSVSRDAILSSHGRRTLERMAECPVVLAVQDTTSLNHSRHPQIRGLGPIGTDAEGTQGLFLHTTLAFTPQRMPLGVLQVQTWARDGNQIGQSERRRQRPIEDKESFKWIKSFQACQRWQTQLAQTLLVNLGDRESDVYELFEQAHGLAAGPYLLIRAEQDRCLAEPSGERLWHWLEQQPVAGYLTVGLKATPKRAARTAEIAVRWARVNLKPPRNAPSRSARPLIPVCAILAQEVNAPLGVEPVCWMLLTNLVVQTTGQALEKVEWYCVRWEIEVFHKILKSACQVEHRQLETLDRLERCLALDLLVAWRIHFLTKHSRQHPDLPASVVFTEDELDLLYQYLQTKPLPASETLTVHQATRMVAQLGGFLGRKGDGEPGPITLSRGLRRLHDMTTGYLVARRSHSPP